MQKYLEKTGEIKFEKIFNQKLGFLLLKDFAENIAENACPQIKFYEAIKEYEKMETPEERLTKAREIYDHHIMVEMLAHAHNYSKDSLQHVQYHLLKGCVPPDLFQRVISERNHTNCFRRTFVRSKERSADARAALYFLFLRTSEPEKITFSGGSGPVARDAA
ncbi:regulator of G protein signaling domain protein [Teladorsagia circumcincta]|uniref:Regulator of G protein signaling domain protein n=1 Tax=Teladorsagia circumcincta TaxID=45464 RepID=A0A2G9UXD7_TELCI|nr:regulator of G protein signaling domain protein [Teladorsagia circumcincta]